MFGFSSPASTCSDLKREERTKCCHCCTGCPCIRAENMPNDQCTQQKTFLKRALRIRRCRGPISRDIAIPSLRYPILRDAFSGLCDTPFCNISRDHLRYPLKTSTKEFCDTSATSIARYQIKSIVVWPQSLVASNDVIELQFGWWLPRWAGIAI